MTDLILTLVCDATMKVDRHQSPLFPRGTHLEPRKRSCTQSRGGVSRPRNCQRTPQTIYLKDVPMLARHELGARRMR